MYNVFDEPVDKAAGKDLGELFTADPDNLKAQVMQL